MPHLWIRAESRPDEARCPVTPKGAARLIAAGFTVTVEASQQRAQPLQPFLDAGASEAPEGSWPQAPSEAIILGLKELPEDGTPLTHRHIMFGHAYKGQPGAGAFLQRFARGGGRLYDLEYLTSETGRRLAAFGYWAGYAGAAVSVMAWCAQQQGRTCPPLTRPGGQEALLAALQEQLAQTASPAPRVIVIGALGRVGSGASDLCTALGLPLTRWDMAETAHGGPFPEILRHEIFLNCILAGPGTPLFVPASARQAPRKLTVIGDIACDPGTEYSPVQVYDRATTWEAPVLRVHDNPPLDVMAIDNLPSLLPLESSQDFAGQLLPCLLEAGDLSAGAWGRAGALFDIHLKEAAQ